MKILINILRTVVFGLLLLFSVSSFITNLRYSPWVPAKRKDLKRLKRLLDIKKEDILYELGCGDGRVCLYISRYSNAKKIVGIEMSFFYFLLARLRVIANNFDHKIHIIWGNFFRKRIKEATKIFFYLTPKTIMRLLPKLISELPEGTLIVSYQYPLSGINYIKKDQPKKEDIPIYIYSLDRNQQKLTYDI